ncbi:MAG: DegT/DnrJ/EryC1/StrS family aminotransferase [Ruminococcus sp.]|nr:DegT/DnrJ/EryC1/StrS family aminotransferase [Ruminococcus sp.]
MEKRNVSFCQPDISELEIQEVAEVLRSGWITTGPKTKQLEKKLAEFCHTEKVVCLGSATAAEELILRVLDIGEGDEVIVPAYTYTASASAVIHVGAAVKLIDSQTDSYEMDYEKVEAAITEHTKAILAVDLGGVPCDYERIYQIVEEKKHLFRPKGSIQKQLGRIAVLADCAHALGAKKDGKMAGQWADFTSFSFHAVKNFTTAEGGAVTWRPIPGVDNEELYRQYQLYSLHGQSKDALEKNRAGSWEYDIVAPLYKCNMTDVMAAIGLKQLERYPGMLERRKEIIQKYDKGCGMLGIESLTHYGDNFQSSGHLYMTRVPWADHEERCAIITKMGERGIACNVHYKPLPMLSAYKKLGWKIEDFPNAYERFQNEITLPLHTKLMDADVEYVLAHFIEIIKESKSHSKSIV